MSLLEEALLLQRAAHDLMYLGMDGSPVYSDDLSRRNGEVYRLTMALYRSGVKGTTIEEQANVCLALLMGYSASFVDHGEKQRHVQKVLDCCWDVLDALPASLLKLRLLTACYGEVFDESLADEGRSIIASWDSLSLTPEQQEAVDEFQNVVDSSNLERNLYLTTQLIDMNVRMVIALNMYDELEASGNTLDYVKLGQLFGVPMLPTISRTGKGIEQLFHIIIGIYEGGDFLDKKGKIRAEILNDLRNWHKEYVPDHDFGTHKEEKEHPAGFYRHIHINHGPELERSIEEVKRIISVNENIRYKYSTRWRMTRIWRRPYRSFPMGRILLKSVTVKYNACAMQ